MIDINELKQGDVLTIFDTVRPKASTVEFMERSRLHSGRIVGYDLSNPQYVLSHISKESINDCCTSWKRDGVELLKQEEEKPLIDINELKHYTIDERGGIIAVIDTKHPNFKQRNNGLHSDDPYVVAHWFGFPHLGHWSLEDWQIEKAKELCKRLNDLSENSDGVELLKQEEEKPLYVFCPIEDKTSGFSINVDKLPWCGDDYLLADINILEQFGDYTFISYANDKSKPPPLAKSPVYRMIDQDCPKVAKYAVFVKTSELHVGE